MCCVRFLKGTPLTQHERHPGQGTDSRSPASRTPAPVDQGGILALQRTAGNAAVLRMLQRSGHPYAPPSVQREAREEPEQHRHGAGCGHQRDVDDRPAVQRSAVHDVLAGGGRPLETPLREEMESRLGADFSDVRIHSGGAARASAAEIGARAYTSGTDVVLGDGGGDKHTLAHELTHVIQQRRGPVSGTDDGGGLSISDPSDRYEREAEANATRVMSGAVPRTPSTAGPAEPHPAGQAIQRMPAERPTRGGAPSSAPYDRPATQDPSLTQSAESSTTQQATDAAAWWTAAWESWQAGYGSHAESYAAFLAYYGQQTQDSGTVAQEAATVGPSWAGGATEITSMDQLAYYELNSNTAIAVNAGSRGDMYHVRAAMVSAGAPTHLLIYNVAEKNMSSAKSYIELIGDLQAKGSEIFWSSLSKEDLGLVDNLKDPGLSHKGDTDSTRYTADALRGQDDSRLQEFYRDYAAPTPEQDTTFTELLTRKKFQRETPYVLVNFRDSGHAGTGNAPALDTGKTGMQNVIDAVRRALGDDVIPVPVGDFPAGHTEREWPGPHLVKYYEWAETKDRRSQLALLYHLNTNFTVLGAVGMRSGVTDQFAFAGIKTISIDITPYQGRQIEEQYPGENAMMRHPSKGWNRGMKLEEAFGPHYGRAFLKDAREDDLRTDDPNWPGYLSDGDQNSITDAVSFYFTNPKAMDTGTGLKADRNNYRHKSHPMNEHEFMEWANRDDITFAEISGTLKQLKDQHFARHLSPKAKKLFTDLCDANHVR